MADKSKSYSLMLSEEEKNELIHVLEDFLVETHMENRRTDNLEFRAELRKEEGVLKLLLEKVRQLGD